VYAERNVALGYLDPTVAKNLRDRDLQFKKKQYAGHLHTTHLKCLNL
jgi:hypothetical protein